jgi:phage tail-like protein
MKSNEIERLLPAVYRRTAIDGSPLAAILSVMEGMHAPSEAVLEHLPTFFDPLTCPSGFLPMLADWVGFGNLLTSRAHWPGEEGRLRLLIANAAELARMRGTAVGLTLFLTLATGWEGFSIVENPLDSHGAIQPFHLRIEAPPGAEQDTALIRTIVEAEKPAYATYELAMREAG